MSDFIETINGRNYTIDEAKQIYINYTLRHGGKITQRFRDCKVKIFPDQLPNGSRALANSNAETNQINMRKEQSIVTFFHECGHLRKAWQDSSGGKILQEFGIPIGRMKRIIQHKCLMKIQQIILFA